jgi:hypothetical protein
MIYKKMSLVMADIGAIGKDQKNQAQGFKFRGIDQFVNALYPALVKHGVFMAPEVVSATHELKEVVRSNGKPGVDKHVTLMVKYRFFAEDGSFAEVGPIASEGLDSGDKATNKALSAALKYALIQTFSIPTEDMAEADLESPTIGVSKSPANELATAATSEPAAAPVTSIAPASAPAAAAPIKTGGFKPPRSTAAKPAVSNGGSGGWE